MKAIYVSNPSKISNAEVEAAVGLINFQITHHVAPMWGRTPVQVYYTSNPDAAADATLIEATDAMSDDLAADLSRLVINAFLNPDGSLHLKDSKGVMHKLDACKPVKDTYIASDGNKSAQLANFILPSWGDASATDVMFDYLGTLSKPFSKAKK